MTNAEQTFFARAAIYIEQGMEFEAACRAVLAADRKIVDFMTTTQDGKKTGRALAAKVYHSVRERNAVNNALNGF